MIRMKADYGLMVFALDKRYNHVTTSAASILFWITTHLQEQQLKKSTDMRCRSRARSCEAGAASERGDAGKPHIQAAC